MITTKWPCTCVSYIRKGMVVVQSMSPKKERTREKMFKRKKKKETLARKHKKKRTTLYIRDVFFKGV